MLGELVTLLKHLCPNNSYGHRYLYHGKDSTEHFHNAQRLWELNKVEVLLTFVGVFLVLLALYMRQ